MGTSLQVEEADVADEVSAPTTLLDLPNELLLLIFQDLDNEALLNLGITCLEMNFIALNHFFFMNNISNPRKGWFIAIAEPPPAETLAVLRSALFVKDFEYFNFELNSRIDRMRSEVSDICALANRLHAMGVFSISFPDIDLSPSVQNSIPIDLWYRSVVNMLEAVLKKGCTRLQVSGRTQFSKLYSNHTPLQEPPQSVQSEGKARSF